MMTGLKKLSTVCGVSSIIAITLLYFGDEIKTSEKGLEIIGQAEGCRREPYKCPANVLTVGIGSTEQSSGKIEHRIYTDLEIASRWKTDIKKAEQCVFQYANGRNIPQSVFDAAVSLTFNAGCGAVKNSTMFRKIKARDYLSACNELPRWVYAGGKKLRGLETRREKERALCLTGLVAH